MKRILLISILLLSCGDILDKPSKGYRVRVVAPNAKGDYGHQIVSLPTLTNIDKVSGSTIYFVDNINLDSNPSLEKIKKESEFQSEYTIKDDVIIPTDYDSLLKFSAYNSFEKIENFWKKVDLSIDFKKPLPVLYDTIYHDKGKKKKGNAFFCNNICGFFLYPLEKKVEKIPFKINLAILAHEYGHRINFKYILNEDPKLASEMLCKYYYKAIEEGLADYFSFCVTGDKNAVYKTFSLDVASRLKYRQIGHYENLDQATKESNYKDCYKEGSVLTSALYNIGEKLSHEEVRDVVLKALPSLSEKILEFGNSDVYAAMKELSLLIVASEPSSLEREIYREEFIKKGLLKI
jgi:hypothetical protein